MKILIIGGGLFGSTAAFTLADKNNTVDLIEESNDIMVRASFVNHNRIHLGYHYLRSIETAEQSIEGLLSFLFTFGNSVRYQFPNYYAIARSGSATTPEQFIDFCNKVGIGYEEEYPEKNLLNKEVISSSFRVPEPVWDYNSIKTTVQQQLARSGVNVVLNKRCNSIHLRHDGQFEVMINNETSCYDIVINATYSNINNINRMLGAESKMLLFEDVFIPKFSFSHVATGLTIMDGKFCSVMPYGNTENEFLLYHVKESILASELSELNPYFEKQYVELSSEMIKNIYRESELFMPFLSEVTHLQYNRTTRTVFKNTDDARLTEISTFENIPNYFSILSGKLTTCMQVALEIKHKIQGKKITKRFKI
ncbi:MAG: FAD-dependent oxidoreductase [Ferruginibacter sp.]